MGKNLELKIKVDEHNFVEQILKESNAEFIDTLNQKDIYYKYDNGLLKLRNVNGNGELIKYNRDELSSERWSDYEILNVDPEKAELFFRDVLKEEAVVKKVRKLWLYKNTRVHLDEVEQLGNFVELETVVKESLEEARKIFDETVELLKLDLSKQLKTSYRTLLMSK